MAHGTSSLQLEWAGIPYWPLRVPLRDSLTPPPPPRSRWDGPVFQQPSFWELLCVTIVANSAGALREVPLLLPEGG